MKYHPFEMIRGVFRFGSIAVVGVVLVAAIGVFLYFNSVLKDLPEVSQLKNFQHEIATEVYSDTNEKIGEFLTERRYAVQFDTIPKHVINAFLAAEDSKFYQHGGLDYSGFVRAVFNNIVRRKYAQGGSTITQQVARSLLLTRKKELSRKIKEIVLALRMEKELTKNEILALYLNEIFLGHGSYGIGAAAHNYFKKDVKDLTIAEGAMLAGLPQRPYEWDPFRNPGDAQRRQHYVLRRMVDEKFITEAQADEARKQQLTLYKLEDLNNTVAPYFTEYVRQYLMDKYGSSNVLHQGFKVYTTVRVDWQKNAERSLERGLREVDKRLGYRGAQKKLKDAAEIESFVNYTHEQSLDKLTQVRLLPPNIDSNFKRLNYDLSLVEKKDSAYFGKTPVKEGEIYPAVVVQIDDKKGLAEAKIGMTSVVLAISSMVDWVKVDNNPPKEISQVLQPGDVIEVLIKQIDRKEGLIYGTLEQEPELQGAILAYDIETGMVRAMIGGRDFNESKFNRALNAKRQVGSTFKPIVYAAAFDKGFSPSSIVSDSPIVFKFEGKLDADSQGEDWRPKNYSGKFEGEIPLRLALIRSMNIPTVKLLNEITVDYGIQYARSLGITATLPRDLSIGLGSWSSSLEEISRAYAVFPRLGRPLSLVYIKKVVDGNGKILEAYSPNQERTPAAVKGSKPPLETDPTLAPQGLVISPQTGYMMTDILRSVVAEGTGRPAAAVYPVNPFIAGKTGTSNDQRDAWFVGYSPTVMAGVWVGFDRDKPLDSGETGGKAAAPIWADFMTYALKEEPKSPFAIPDDIEFAYIDRYTGQLANSTTSNRVKVAFRPGTKPNRNGDNIPRVGEPGIRMMSNAPGNAEATPLPMPQGAEQDSDFLREGYQD